MYDKYEPIEHKPLTQLDTIFLDTQLIPHVCR